MYILITQRLKDTMMIDKDYKSNSLVRTSHTDIGKMIDDLTDQKNNNQHNREVLDDIISDLIQYRSTLPSIEWYKKHNRL